MRTIIVDDEKYSRKLLKELIQKYCPDLELVGSCENVKEAIKAIINKKPELIFLDIEMPNEDGFALFEYFEEPPFETIFATAYSEYAIKAIRQSALDYLLKPINKDELLTAVAKAKEKRTLQTSQPASILNSKLFLPSQDHIAIIDKSDIIRCEAQANYTLIHIQNKPAILVSKNLKHYETMLDGFGFMRVHRGHLVNLGEITEISRIKNAFITLKDGSNIPITSDKKKEVMELLKKN